MSPNQVQLLFNNLSLFILLFFDRQNYHECCMDQFISMLYVISPFLWNFRLFPSAIVQILLFLMAFVDNNSNAATNVVTFTLMWYEYNSTHV